MIENFSRLLLLNRQHCFHDSLQQRNIAVDSDLQKQIGELSAGTEHSENVLRMFEADHPDFRKRVDVDQLATVSLRVLECGQHSRVVRSRVLPDYKDGL